MADRITELQQYIDEKRDIPFVGPPVPRIRLLSFDRSVLMDQIKPESYLIPDMVPTESYTVIAGALSAAKTTFLHSLLLWRATGYDMLNLTPEKSSGIDMGPCVLLSYEDSDNRIVKRFQRLVQHQIAQIRRVHGERSAGEYFDRLEKNLKRITLTGQRLSGIVRREEGAIVENTEQVDYILQAVGSFATEGVMFGIDPLRLAIVGSQNDDDGAEVVVHTLNRMATHFPNSGLAVPSHTTKNQAKEGGQGMADAAYATAGSALYSQHARSNFHLARCTSELMRTEFPLEVFTDEEVAKQAATCLTHGRLSHGAEGEQRFFAMRNGVLEPVTKASTVKTLAEKGAQYIPAIREALLRIQMAGMVASRKALESDDELARILSRGKLREFVGLAVDQGWLLETGATNKKRLELSPVANERFGESLEF